MRNLLKLSLCYVATFLIVSLALVESSFLAGADEKINNETGKDPTSTEASTGENFSLKATIETCESCHAKQTDSKSAMPIISGQQFAYLYTQLKDYQGGRRDGHPIEFKETRDDLQNIANHFSREVWGKTSNSKKKENIILIINDTWLKYVSHSKKEKIAAAKRAIETVGCFSCHRDNFMGDSNAPRLAGQNFNYLKKTMLDLKYGRRKNASSMSSLVSTVSDDDLEAIASYLYEFKKP